MGPPPEGIVDALAAGRVAKWDSGRPIVGDTRAAVVVLLRHNGVPRGRGRADGGGG